MYTLEQIKEVISELAKPYPKIAEAIKHQIDDWVEWDRKNQQHVINPFYASRASDLAEEVKKLLTQ